MFHEKFNPNNRFVVYTNSVGVARDLYPNALVIGPGGEIDHYENPRSDLERIRPDMWLTTITSDDPEATEYCFQNGISVLWVNIEVDKEVVIDAHKEIVDSDQEKTVVSKKDQKRLKTADFTQLAEATPENLKQCARQIKDEDN